ncbi:tetratricopeptide repeat protein [Thiohalocapsa sp.]|jgi:hypothetical protein|uniref:tetratricopeptide repeat protein n=1 Tax=Thiohalocapsa sp. TaxID=2497641 RepID=UPI0025F3DC75|nr:tetratricopeptide repeat protein [Thiohalocapsa sp.]
MIPLHPPRSVLPPLAGATLGLLLAGCASSGGESVYAQAAGANDNPATVERLVNQAEDLTVVDCLLPGRMRRMGTTVTWVTRPRPVKKTATDCEILGGQYILFDRANPSTALAVWRSAADAGDATAQTYVGEIYERGLTGTANPAEAARWYKKAADQGFARAQLLLGNLYEKGQGVPKDPVQALDLYRKAADLNEDKVVYLREAVAQAKSEYAAEAAARRAAAQRAAANRARAQAQYQAVRQRAASGQQEVQRTEAQVQQAKQEVVKSRSTRLLDQPAPAVAANRRLVDQYVAVAAQAQAQQTQLAATQRIEGLAGPALAQN